MPGELKIK